jgi:DNA polymerase III delta prime subunit
MHAFLLIGTNNKQLKEKTKELAEKLNAKIMEFPLVKIDDVRNLNSLIRLSFSEPTLIISENIEEATEEALNAFLKNLEEPQENIYFALTATSIKKVLPTIVSRCQIIKIRDVEQGTQNEEVAIQFLDMLPSLKLGFIDKIKDRDEAIDFVESLIFFLNKKRNLTNMELLLKTRTCLKANGNVNLHLLNLVTQYGK